VGSVGAERKFNSAADVQILLLSFTWASNYHVQRVKYSINKNYSILTVKEFKTVLTNNRCWVICLGYQELRNKVQTGNNTFPPCSNKKQVEAKGSTCNKLAFA